MVRLIPQSEKHKNKKIQINKYTIAPLLGNTVGLQIQFTDTGYSFLYGFGASQSGVVDKDQHNADVVGEAKMAVGYYFVCVSYVCIKTSQHVISHVSMVQLMKFSPDAEYTPGKLLPVAGILSRSPQRETYCTGET